jgi:hypothetical protein
MLSKGVNILFSVNLARTCHFKFIESNCISWVYKVGESVHVRSPPLKLVSSLGLPSGVQAVLWLEVLELCQSTGQQRWLVFHRLSRRLPSGQWTSQHLYSSAGTVSASSVAVFTCNCSLRVRRHCVTLRYPEWATLLSYQLSTSWRSCLKSVCIFGSTSLVDEVGRPH